ncbi:charged multivesicular body protein 5 [Angomonas deanei]|uniref:Snf7, putative n=1 Tax=Angomonas deanei TaxID=59799 RepID=S9V4I0_9TRYP|nr:charged multivesicular body protein 5 [Angomonas deanei]EPY38214.1 charged multivesicular body protein 5 [Angomonas deanei]CAD2214629.1 Snf7, putative [Angomonas deanei]|eukprot:EPY35788.1 charged multivesicular body protein 5 [Angomonas deanei]
MNRLFGKGNKEPKPTLDDAGNRIQGRSDVVDARVAKIDDELAKLKVQIQRSRGMAQQRYKQRAVQLLQQKRMYQNQQDVMMQQQFNMDQLQFTTEMVKDTHVQVAAMKDANKQLKKDFKKLNIDKIDAMQDELADLYMDTQEVQEIMGRAYDIPDDIDEDEMLGELDALDFDMEKTGEADYLNDALAMPNQKMPELQGQTQTTTGESESNPYSLEQQLGL